MNTPTYSQACEALSFSGWLKYVHTHTHTHFCRKDNSKEGGRQCDEWMASQGREIRAGSLIECKPFLKCCLSPYRAYKTIEDEDLKFPLIYGEGKKVGVFTSPSLTARPALLRPWQSVLPLSSSWFYRLDSLKEHLLHHSSGLLS